MTQSIGAHLLNDHGWRMMWMFGMDNEEKRRIHDIRHPECDWPGSRLAQGPTEAAREFLREMP